MNSMDAATTDICALTREFFRLLIPTAADLLLHYCLLVTLPRSVGSLPHEACNLQCLPISADMVMPKFPACVDLLTLDCLSSAFVPSCANAATQATSTSRGATTELPSTLLTSVERAWGRAMRSQSAAIAAESPASGSTARVVAIPATSGEASRHTFVHHLWKTCLHVLPPCNADVGCFRWQLTWICFRCQPL